jgi:hypothetical protein
VKHPRLINYKIIAVSDRLASPQRFTFERVAF